MPPFTGVFGHSIVIRHEGFGETVDEEASTLQEFYALDPVPVIEYLTEENRPIDLVQKCNRFIMPSGFDYGRGWILMRGDDAKRLWKLNSNRPYTSITSKDQIYRLTLIFRPDGVSESEQIEIKRLEILRIQSVTGYSIDYWTESKAEEHYVIVELVDARYTANMSSLSDRSWAFNTVAYNEYEDIPPITQHWTPRGLSYPPQQRTYIGRKSVPYKNISGPDSYKPYTWEEVVQCLLAELPGYQFYHPSADQNNIDTSKAKYPQGVPENLNFSGRTAWSSLCEILHQTSNTIYRDLEGKWHIVSQKDNSQPFTKESDIQNFLEDPTWNVPRNPFGTFPSSMEEFQNIMVPEKLLVHFKTQYGDPNAVGDLGPHALDNYDQFYTYPLRTVETYLNSGTIRGTKTHIYAPMQYSLAYYDSDRTAQESLFNDLADELGELFIAAKGWTAKTLHNIYIYYHSVECGTDVSAVQWYNIGNGPRTEILRKPLKYVPGDEKFYLGKQHKEEVLSWENFSPPNVNRKLPPTTRFKLAQVLEDLDPAINSYSCATTLRVRCEVYQGSEGLTQIYPEDNIDTSKVLPNSGSGLGDTGSHQVWANNLFDIPIQKGTYVYLMWEIESKSWWIISAREQCVTDFFVGKLALDLCPQDEYGYATTFTTCFDNFQKCASKYTEDQSNGLTLTKVRNTFKLAGKQGDVVFGYSIRTRTCRKSDGTTEPFDPNADLPFPNTYGWNLECNLLQIEHQTITVVEGFQALESDANCTVDVPPEEFDHGFDLYYKNRECAVMSCKQQALSSVLYGKAIFVMTDWFVEGLCIKARYKKIWTLKVCDTSVSSIVHRGTDCAGGSCTL